jgi:TPR repeat protein
MPCWEIEEYIHNYAKTYHLIDAEAAYELGKRKKCEADRSYAASFSIIPNSTFNIGQIMESVRSSEKNYRIALRYFILAEYSLGKRDSLSEINEIYTLQSNVFRMQKVTVDDANWYESMIDTASKEPYLLAFMGMLYSKGHGTIPDTSYALSYYQSAAMLLIDKGLSGFEDLIEALRPLNPIAVTTTLQNLQRYRSSFVNTSSRLKV